MVDFNLILQNLIEAFLHIIKSPFEKAEIWWYLFPILALWFTLELYFGFYKKEAMGWNTALGNSFSLAWVSIEGMRVLFEKTLDLFWLRFSILSLAIVYCIMIIYLVFTHKIKDKYAFIAASPHIIYYLSAVSILWMHGSLVIDFWVLITLVILFFITVLFFIIIKKILPQKAESGSDDYQYDKVGFDGSTSPETSEPEPANAQDSGSPMDFMNFK